MALVALILSGIALADARTDYDMLKVRIQEKKRELNRLHGLREYPAAMKAQKELGELSQEALELALKSPDIDNRGAWNFHADTMREAGLLEEALKAVDEYMKTPLLDRNGHREGWKKRGQIHARRRDTEKARRAYEKALTYADKPRDQFNLHRDLANLYLRESDNEAAASEIRQMEPLLAAIDEERRTEARRDYQSMLVKLYKAKGDAPAARAARLKELELRKVLLDRELEDFPNRFPED